MYRNYTGRPRRASGLLIWPFFIFAAAIFILSAIFILPVTGMGFLFQFCGVFSGLMALFGALNLVIEQVEGRKAAKAFRVARIAYLALAALGTISFVVVQLIIAGGEKTDARPGAGAMIVLGAGLEGENPSLSLRGRMDTAYTYLRDNPDTVAILSGGQGPGESITEAEAMFRYLSQRGIEPERMIKEDKSHNTAENIRFSKVLLEEHGLSGGRLVVVSQGFHLYRARELAKKNDLEVEVLSAPSPYWYLDIAFRVREYFSVVFMWFGRV